MKKLILAAVMLFSMQSHSMEKPEEIKPIMSKPVAAATTVLTAVAISKETYIPAVVIGGCLNIPALPLLVVGGVSYMGYKTYKYVTKD